MAKTYIFINTYQQLFKMMRNQGFDLATFYDVIVMSPWSYWLAFSAFAWDLRWDECFKKVDKLVEIRWNSKNIQKFKNTMSFIIPDL